MLETIVYLLGFQLLGEALAHYLTWKIPGPVLGMLLLYLWLWVRRGVPKGLSTRLPMLLGHMSLLFIPAGGAILAYQGLLGDYAGRLIVVLVLSTLLTLLVPGVVLHYWLKRQARKAP